MNNIANWSTNTIPTSGYDAIFDSQYHGVSKNPTDNSVPFIVSSFNFPHNASSFIFDFNNTRLTFEGDGITGNKTDTTIYATNTNNNLYNTLVSFLGLTSTSGSSRIICTNTGTQTGNVFGSETGAIGAFVYSSDPFSIGNNGTITATNIGLDSTNGMGTNNTCTAGLGQLQFSQTFTAGNNVSISATNDGTFSGSTSASGNMLCSIIGNQFLASDTFQAGNNFTCEIANTATDSSTGIGNNMIGQIYAPQMEMLTSGIIGNNCSINVANTGVNTSQTSNPSNIAYLNDQQFVVTGSFQAGSDFSLAVSNTGTDSSVGYGLAQVAVINSDSGKTGQQVLFDLDTTLGERASIAIANTGTYTGSNTQKGCSVATLNSSQLVIGGNSYPTDYYAFNADDDFSLAVSCTGNDSSLGHGGNGVGIVAADQVAIFVPTVLGDNARIAIDKSGRYSGQTSGPYIEPAYITVGSCGGSQLNCGSTFEAGDNFSLAINNSGSHQGTGHGADFIGVLSFGQQANFADDVTLGNNANIVVFNSGTNSSNTDRNNTVGSMNSYGKQLAVDGRFQTGDDLSVFLVNSGFDNSSNVSGSLVAFMNNNKADNTGSQMHLGNGGAIGDRGRLFILNQGRYAGTNTGTGSLVGAIAGQQLHSASDFNAGEEFTLLVLNLGECDSSNHSGAAIGTVGNDAQVTFSGDTNLGNSSTIIILNSGINKDTLGTSNLIGFISGSQMDVKGDFSAGDDLSLIVYNTANNLGDSSNYVGYINNSQLHFERACTLNDGSSITAYNGGTVTNSQITFDQGFSVATGKASILASNDGTFGLFGIDIQGNSNGGNADIILNNSTLNVQTTQSTFTIGGLGGDSTSMAQSSPTLIINTDAATKIEFAGVIKDFPSMSSTLVKSGPGTQILSGANSYTGLTSVDDGFLVVNGSLAANVLVNPVGTLKGSGTIFGTLTNTGTVAPGQSIGTITVGTYVNNSGNYDVEVNGLGQSDLIDVIGAATINGGTVIVSSPDGTFNFQHPYTIVTANGGVTGAYTNATSLAFIRPTLTYDANHVYLTLQSDLSSIAVTCNQTGVANLLDSIIDPNAVQTAFISAIANSSIADAQESLESFSGFQYTNEVILNQISANRLVRRLYDPLRSLVNNCICGSCAQSSAWLEASDGCTTVHGKDSHKIHCNSFDITGGAHQNICDFTLGIAGSYQYDHIKYKDGKANCNTGYLGLYGLYRSCLFYGLADIIYGHRHNNLSREIHAGSLRSISHSKPITNNGTFYGEIGFDLFDGCILVQPFLALQVEKNWRRHIHESNRDGWGLDIPKRDWTTTTSRVGLHLSTCQLCDCIDSSLDIAWNQLLSSPKRSTVGHFQDFGDSFKICGNRLNDYSIDYAFTFAACLCDNIQGYIELGGEWMQRANTFNVVGGIKYSW